MRGASIDALGDIGPDAASAAGPTIAQYLKDEDPAVRARSIAALRNIHWSAGNMVSALLSAAHDPDGYVRSQALESLDAMTPTPDGAKDIFIDAAEHDTDAGSREKAIAALGCIGKGSPSARQALLSVMAGDNEYVRDKAAHCVGDWGPSVITFIAPMLRDPSASVRIAAATSAAAVGEGAEPVLPDLIALLKDPDENVRFSAASAIAEIGVGADSAVPALRDALCDPSFEVRDGALHALGRMGPAALPAIDAIVACLRDPRNEVRYDVGFAFSSLSDWPVQPTSDETVRTLIGLLSDPDEQTRQALRRVWGSSGGVPRRSRRRSCAFRSKTFKAYEADVFGRIGVADPEVIALLIEMLQKARKTDLVVLTTALSKLKPLPGAAIPPLINVLSSDDAIAQLSAAYALSRFGPDAAAALPALNRLASSRSSRPGGAGRGSMRSGRPHCRIEAGRKRHRRSVRSPDQYPYLVSDDPGHLIGFGRPSGAGRSRASRRGRPHSDGPSRPAKYRRRRSAAGPRKGRPGSALPKLREMLHGDTKLVRRAAMETIRKIEACMIPGRSAGTPRRNACSASGEARVKSEAGRSTLRRSAMAVANDGAAGAGEDLPVPTYFALHG